MADVRLQLHATGDQARNPSQDPPGLALRALFAPLQQLLVAGGDARLIVDPTSGLNAYLCQPDPAPEVLSFSSSTATSISEPAYQRAGRARDELMQAVIEHGLDEAFDRRIEQLRGELKAQLGLSDGVEVIFAASGTDAQLQALHLARSVLGPALTTIIVAADQTGSGTPQTARGMHFSDLTANGRRVTKREPIAGLSESVDSIALSLRDERGEIRPQAHNDFLVLNAVERATANGGNVLLQIMDSSKLGRRAPSERCLGEVAARWPKRVMVVVDACQMRLGRRRIAAYLSRGYIVAVTGSKYFAGPPFSGALLVPSGVAKAVADVSKVASGFLDYSGRYDWPQSWRALRAEFPARYNFGQWLRWEAALEEIAAYFAVPDGFRRQALAELGEGIVRIIAASPSLRLLALPDKGADDDDEMALPTVFAFTVNFGGQWMALNDCRALYGALARDMRAETTTEPGGQIADVAAQVCVVGQPVGWTGRDGQSLAALRLCIGARHVTEAWSPDQNQSRCNLQRVVDRVSLVVEKVEWLLENADQWSENRDGS